MTKIITFIAHDNPYEGGGTLTYCKALEDLFKNSKSIQIKESDILPYKSFLGYKFKYKQIEEYLKKEKPDIIHVNGYTSLLLSQLTSIAKSLGIKLVYTPHWHPFKTMRLPLLKELYFNLFVKPFLKRIDAIVCINNEDCAFFKKFSRNVHKIPHWITKDNSIEDPVAQIENQILFIGSLTHPNKGFKYLFHLPANKYKIICVGEGNDISLRSDMTHLSNITNAQLKVLYHQSSLLVIPSLYEAFSYVALEALSAGTPVVMSENVRIADYLTGFDGIKIYNMESPSQFVNAVEQSIGQKFDNSFILNLFSKESALKEYTNLYNSIV